MNKFFVNNVGNSVFYLIVINALISVELNSCRDVFNRSNTDQGAILISQYSNVARVGSQPSVSAEGRGFGSGQSLWTFGSNTNFDNNPVVTSRKSTSTSQFHYPVFNQNNYDPVDGNPVDNEGEVEEIDRYIPKPYFGYGDSTDIKSTYTYPKPSNTFPSEDSPTSFINARPVPTSVISDVKPDTDSNDATISYTPPPDYKPDTKEKDSYMLDSMKDNQKEPKKTLYDSYAPPAAGTVANSPVPPDFDGYIYPPNDQSKQPSKNEQPFDDHFYPSMVIDMDADDASKNPVKPEKMPNKDNSHDLTYFHDHTPEKGPFHGPGPSLHSLPEYLEYKPSDHEHHAHDFHPEDHHEHHHHHHQVYHEVKSTTPKPMEEKERVDKRPYSYYYLGRKLWYIPLYFSLYFIVYIFALIIKSIMRHKVKFPNEHDWTKFRSARSNNGQEIVNTVTESVLRGIENGYQKYYAM